MPGTKEGAQKAKQKILEKNPNFYKDIGAKSWKNERSHEIGFALLPKEKHLEISKKGGSVKKDDYKTADVAPETDQTSTGES